MRKRSSVMVGRDTLLKCLVDHFDCLAEDCPQFVMIRGEAGIGKSRILEEFIRRVTKKDVIILKGDCLPLHICGAPFAPLIQALRNPVIEVASHTPAAPLEAELARLTSTISPLGTPAPPALTHFTSQIPERVLSTLLRLSQHAPVVLAIEDVHWADAATLELIQFLHHNLHRSRTLLALTERTDEPSPQPAYITLVAELLRAGAEAIELESLDANDVRQLLSARGGGPVPRHVAVEIHRRSGGNPLYCEFLQDAWSTGASLPNTLKDLLLARVSRISRHTRSVLELLAVVGYPTSEDLLKALWDGDAIAPSVREAVDAKLLACGNGTYQFRHSLIREALLDELLPGDLALLHRRVAAALAAQPSLAEDANHLVALRVANHWYAAGERAAALEAAVRAGLMIDLSSPADALQLYERALGLSILMPQWPIKEIGRAEVLRRAAEASFYSGDVAKARELVRKALAVTTPSQPGDPSPALLYEHLGRYLEGSNGNASGQECRECYERALRELSASGSPQTQARVLCSCGLSRVLTGSPDEGMALLRKAGTIAERCNDLHLQAVTSINLAEAASCVRDPATSIAYARQAREAARRIDYSDLVLRTYFTEANAAYSASGRLADSIRIRWEGVRFADQHGQAHFGGTMLRLALIEDLIEAGLWDEAASLMSDRPPSNLRSILEAEEHLVLCYLAAERGQAVDGVRVSELRHLLPVDNLVHETYFLSLLIPVAWTLHRAQIVEELSDRAIELASYTLPPLGGGLFLVHALTAVIQAHAHRADAEGACAHDVRDLLRIAEDVYARSRISVVAEVELTDGVIEVARAEVQRCLGVDGTDHWSRATAVFRHTGALARLAYALFREGQTMLAYRTDAARARKKLKEAYSSAEKMGAEPLRQQIKHFAEGDALRADMTAPAFADLTPRQAEVLRLIADGLTDREIAEVFTISTRTANSHVANILERLGVRNRAEAATRYHQMRYPIQKATIDLALPVADT